MTRRSNRAEHEKAAPSRSRALTVRAKCSSKTAFIFSKTASMDQNRCVASPGSHELRDHRCRSVTARTRDRITDPSIQRRAGRVRLSGRPHAAGGAATRPRAGVAHSARAGEETAAERWDPCAIQLPPPSGFSVATQDATRTLTFSPGRQKMTHQKFKTQHVQ